MAAIDVTVGPHDRRELSFSPNKGGLRWRRNIEI
jgi:hypothetical protein